MDAMEVVGKLYSAAIRRDDHEEAKKLEEIIEGWNGSYEQPFIMLPVAMWYAERQWPVFPLQPRSKIPFKDSHGFQDATYDIDVIQRWWSNAPHANIGTPTGIDFDVFDIDDDVGRVSMVQLLDNDPDFPPVLGLALTPNGLHIYVPDTGLGNRAALKPGIDYRGKGGYVVMPPSSTSEGDYAWIRCPNLENG